jgi:hypothetical protein
MHSRLFGPSAYPSASFMLFALFFVAVVHCAAAGTAVAVTHAPKARAASAPMGALLNNLAIHNLLHSATPRRRNPWCLAGTRPISHPEQLSLNSP